MKWTAILGFVLAAMGGTAWAQEPEQPINVTGRILFGYADLSQGSYSQSGPAATLETDFRGFWRDPRILEFEVKPIVTLGEPVPGTEIGNAVTGLSASGSVLEGSSFPLTVSYSRFSSPLGGYYTSGTSTNPNQDVLSGAEGKTINSVFDVRWILRFKHWPTVNLDYRDTDYNSELPQALGAQDDNSLHDFTAHINYNQWGWALAGRYQHSEFTTTAPDILTDSVQSDTGTTSDLGFTASRLLPLHSTLGVAADQSKSDYSVSGLQTDLSVHTANAILASQPMERLSTTVQMQYTSNLQASEVQQALAGAGVPGISVSPAPVSTEATPASTGPISYLAAPYKVLTVYGSATFRLGRGFSVNGSLGESDTSPNSGTSTQWSAGLNYNHKWSSGFFSTGYSYSRMTTEVEVVSENSQGTETYSPFSQVLDVNTVAVNLGQNLPSQFRLVTSGQVSEGTLEENEVPYPYHQYGGLASLSRPVGQWTLTGSLNLNEIATHVPLEYNESKSKSASLGAAYRGLNLSAGYQYGSGLALQVGNSLLFVNGSQPVGSALGGPVLSSTSGTFVNGTYRSRRSRLMLTGYWYRFHYTADQLYKSEYDLLNLHGSYKLRRLRLIVGYVRQSQVLAVGSSGMYENRLVYFQVERVFRLR